MEKVTIFVDGATAGGRYSGIAAIALTTEGGFLGWASRRLPSMTNNEAEYESVLLGLRLARALQAPRVEIVSDSEVVVRQMQGRSQVHSSGLRSLYQQTCASCRHFQAVEFRHVAREQNRLADALAAEALAGRERIMRAEKKLSGSRSFLTRLR